MTTNDWPALPYAEWRDTLDTLHMFTQIVGKIRLALAPDEPQWGQVPLYPTARGLSTSAMPWGDGTIDMEFDLLDHELVVRASNRRTMRIPLTNRSVADFYKEVMAALEAFDVHIVINPAPQEFADPILFPDDGIHHSYDQDAVARYFDVLTRTGTILHAYRARFRGRTTPVQFFWGSFDLVNVRFSGAPATPPPDSDFIMRRSHDAEQISVGFWPGDQSSPEAAYFGYGYPQPDRIANASVAPARAAWNADAGLFLLRYDDACAADDPARAIREFFDSVYIACASRMGWSPSLVSAQ